MKDLEDVRNKIEFDFSKYSNYFKLREVANEFASSLSLKKTAKLIVHQALDIIKKGDSCLLFLTDVSEGTLALTASRTRPGRVESLLKMGTEFDQWVLRSKQHLIITDLTKDFRFSYNEMEQSQSIRSLIAAPLVAEGKVIGTLRVNAESPECFATDDLRILNILAILGASAIWNARLYNQTEELAIRDSLTNLYVNRYFKQRLKEEHRRSLLTNAPMSLLMCDLDHFKKYNDQYGHAAGDLLLKHIAGMLNHLLDKDNLISRYGGEEFAVILPNTSKTRAVEIGKNICHHVGVSTVDLRGIKTRITLSIGVAAFPEDTLDYEDLILKADRRLYDAKRKGRNQVC